MNSAYAQGWNAWLDGKGWDDNPWVEHSDSGDAWCRGHMDAEKMAGEIGTDQMERLK